MDYDELAGRIVQKARVDAGLTQAELAERLASLGFSMHQQTIAKIERGARPLKLEEAQYIAKVTGRDSWIFDEALPGGAVALQIIHADWQAARERARLAILNYARLWDRLFEAVDAADSDTLIQADLMFVQDQINSPNGFQASIERFASNAIQHVADGDDAPVRFADDQPGEVSGGVDK